MPNNTTFLSSNEIVRVVTNSVSTLRRDCRSLRHLVTYPLFSLDSQHIILLYSPPLYIREGGVGLLGRFYMAECGGREGILIQHATHDVGPTMTAPIPALIFHRFYSPPFSLPFPSVAPRLPYSAFSCHRSPCPFAPFLLQCRRH